MRSECEKEKEEGNGQFLRVEEEGVSGCESGSGRGSSMCVF